jgi:hypothetical protein
MLCISRYTDDTYAQTFGDGRHKFYLEFRCNRPCLKNMDCCAKCAEKSVTALQYSRRFNHGNVNEPIPDNSHIFGGKWYHDGLKKWSAPPSEIIEFALAYQKEARGDYIVNQPDYDELSKAKQESHSQEMVRRTNVNDNTVAAPKRSRKPKIADTDTAIAIATNDTVEEKQVIKRVRKPKIADDGQPKPNSRKKPADTPYSTIVNTPQLVHKEVSIPSHIETKLEEFDIDGYSIEYIKLVPFEINGTMYFKDENKLKLYKKIKEKGIGAYIGRWNPDTDTIHTDIPDSDNEN